MMQQNLAAVYFKDGVHHDSVKMQKDLFLLPCSGNTDGFGIISHPAVVIAHSRCRRCVLTDVVLQHVIVREVHGSGGAFPGEFISRHERAVLEFPSAVYVDGAGKGVPAGFIIYNISIHFFSFPENLF